MTAVPVHHETAGRSDASAVLLIGSLGSTLEMWAPQMLALAERFHVIRYDTRGHGRSAVPPGPYSIDDLADDAVSLLDHLGLERAHVVGLSLGGMTAMRLAAREPARVDRLALLCTSAHLAPAADWTQRAAAVRAGGTTVVAEAVVGRWLTPAGRDPHLVEQLQTMVADTPREGYAGCCEAIAAMDLRGDLPDITAPTLAIAGAEDQAMPPEHLAAIVEAVPGARLLVLPHAAHLANVEQGDAVNAALQAHLDPAGVSTHERGTAVRRSVLGDAHVDQAMHSTSRFNAPFQDLITRYAWGDVWSRPGLDLRTRSLLTLALLTALGHEHELALHIRGAINNRVTPEEIAEVLLHSAVYAGVPRANRAFVVAQETLTDLGLPDPTEPGT